MRAAGSRCWTSRAPRSSIAPRRRRHARLDSLADEAYQGPLVLRVDPDEALPAPRRLDLVVARLPEGAGAAARHGAAVPLHLGGGEPPSSDLILLSSVGEISVLGDTGLRRLARLPSGHYHRTHMAVGPDGSVFVSTGFHIRTLYRISPGGRGERRRARARRSRGHRVWTLRTALRRRRRAAPDHPDQPRVRPLTRPPAAVRRNGPDRATSSCRGGVGGGRPPPRDHVPSTIAAVRPRT